MISRDGRGGGDGRSDTPVGSGTVSLRMVDSASYFERGEISRRTIREKLEKLPLIESILERTTVPPSLESSKNILLEIGKHCREAKRT